MSKQVPFTAHIKITPERPGKKAEYLRSMEKIAVLAYNGLLDVENITIASPGGGVHSTFGDVNRRGGFGYYGQGTAVKPQVGGAPAQLTITGFYEVDSNNTQEYTNTQRISGGETYSGPDSHTNDEMPNTAVNNSVKALKTALMAAIEAALPDTANPIMFKLQYAGIVFGHGGFHFPR